jgi:hypothetical protein
MGKGQGTHGSRVFIYQPPCANGIDIINRPRTDFFNRHPQQQQTTG